MSSSLATRRAGFRLSLVDLVVLGLAGLALTLGPLGTMYALVVGHFFLFCNVIRLRRSYELIWAAGFIALSTALLASERWSGSLVLWLSSPLTVILCGLELRSERYHGVLFRMQRRWLCGSGRFRPCRAAREAELFEHPDARAPVGDRGLE